MATDKARFAYGSKSKVAAAIESGAINEYDFLCLSGENERPSVGWVDANGNPIFVECVKYVEVVSVLPETGEEGIIYMLEGKGHVWYDGTFVPMTSSADLSALEAKIDSKVDTKTVETMIETAVAEASGFEIVEF
jgi:hypothetical protein